MGVGCHTWTTLSVALPPSSGSALRAACMLCGLKSVATTTSRGRRWSSPLTASTGQLVWRITRSVVSPPSRRSIGRCRPIPITTREASSSLVRRSSPLTGSPCSTSSCHGWSALRTVGEPGAEILDARHSARLLDLGRQVDLLAVERLDRSGLDGGIHVHPFVSERRKRRGRAKDVSAVLPHRGHDGPGEV